MKAALTAAFFVYHLEVVFMYKVYVLYSVNFKKTYVGYTQDLPSRLASHNTLATKGYTIRYRPWMVIHVESFASKREAILREKELKSGNGRTFIKNLISEGCYDSAN